MESFFKNFGDDFQEATPPLVNQTAGTFNPMDSTSGLPPPNVEIPTFVASAILQPRMTFEVASSSAPKNVSLTRHEHDIVSERLARFLEESEANLLSGEKGISIGAGSLKGEDTSKPELREEIIVLKQKIIEKDLQIENLDSRISVLEDETGYINLKNKLIVEFGDKFQTATESPSIPQAPITAPATTPTFEQTDNVPVRTTTVVDRFEMEHAQDPPRITIKRGGRMVMSQKMRGLLFMKNSD
ncbi:unnamed protein product [Lactuca saligna]|uniref:Uncharacterized protein n=1 Tax=Lactuca saligna TaxID=75948 RepID=A0AA35Z0Y4_LACSI|nr:unnamed protein product [Lactuca saligna]